MPKTHHHGSKPHSQTTTTKPLLVTFAVLGCCVLDGLSTGLGAAIINPDSDIDWGFTTGLQFGALSAVIWLPLTTILLYIASTQIKPKGTTHNKTTLATLIGARVSFITAAFFASSAPTSLICHSLVTPSPGLFKVFAANGFGRIPLLPFLFLTLCCSISQITQQSEIKKRNKRRKRPKFTPPPANAHAFDDTTGETKPSGGRRQPTASTFASSVARASLHMNSTEGHEVDVTVTMTTPSHLQTRQQTNPSPSSSSTSELQRIHTGNLEELFGSAPPNGDDSTPPAQSPTSSENPSPISAAQAQNASSATIAPPSPRAQSPIDNAAVIIEVAAQDVQVVATGQEAKPSEQAQTRPTEIDASSSHPFLIRAGSTQSEYSPANTTPASRAQSEEPPEDENASPADTKAEESRAHVVLELNQFNFLDIDAFDSQHLRYLLNTTDHPMSDEAIEYLGQHKDRIYDHIKHKQHSDFQTYKSAINTIVEKEDSPLGLIFRVTRRIIHLRVLSFSAGVAPDRGVFGKVMHDYEMLQQETRSAATLR